MPTKQSPQAPAPLPENKKSRSPFGGRKGGPTIIATIGEHARNVVVGTHIVQIGSVNIPVRALALGVGLILMAVLGSYFLLYQAVIPEPPAPERMSGRFNVAVAEFGRVEDPARSEPVPDEDGQYLTRTVATELQTKLDEIPGLSDWVKLEHEHVGIVPGNTPEAREAAVAQLAKDINADVVIYGNVDGTRSQLKPQFYVSPRLEGAEETTAGTGANAFGKPFLVYRGVAGNADLRPKLLDEAIPRFAALTEFMVGLAFYKADKPDLAIRHLESALQIEEWEDKPGSGKEILYLWLGSAFNKRALQGGEPGAVACPVDEMATSDWECARAAWEHALELNDRFARAYIGLGKLWSDQAVQVRDGQEILVCQAYERAAAAYLEALDPAMESAETAYVDLKSYFNLGLSYAIAYRKGCKHSSEDLDALAVENLDKAIEAHARYRPTPLVGEIGAKAYYQLGLVHNLAGRYAEAAEAFGKVRVVAEPAEGDAYQDDWQAIRWNADVQRAHVYLKEAEAGSSKRWRDAAELFERVVTDGGGIFGADPLTIADANYGLGIARHGLGQPDQAIAPLQISIESAELQAQEGHANLGGLPWLAYVELGKVYATLAESGDSGAWRQALDAFEQVVARFDAGSTAITRRLAAEACYGAGMAHEALGDPTLAGESFRRALALGESDSDVYRLAQQRLAVLGGP